MDQTPLAIWATNAKQAKTGDDIDQRPPKYWEAQQWDSSFEG